MENELLPGKTRCCGFGSLSLIKVTMGLGGLM